jgi:hypothetical protein
VRSREATVKQLAATRVALIRERFSRRTQGYIDALEWVLEIE